MCQKTPCGKKNNNILTPNPGLLQHTSSNLLSLLLSVLSLTGLVPKEQLQIRANYVCSWMYKQRYDDMIERRVWGKISRLEGEFAAGCTDSRSELHLCFLRFYLTEQGRGCARRSRPFGRWRVVILNGRQAALALPCLYALTLALCTHYTIQWQPNRICFCRSISY